MKSENYLPNASVILYQGFHQHQAFVVQNATVFSSHEVEKKILVL